MGLYKQIFDSTPDGVLIVAPDGKILFGNPAAETLFDYPPRGLEDLPVERLIPERFWETHAQHLKDYFEHPSPRAMGNGDKLLGVRHNGEEFYVDVMLAPVQFGHHSAALCIVRDITPQILIQQKQQIANLVFSSAQEAISITDVHGVITAVNPAFEKVTEYTEQEVLGQRMSILKSGRHDAAFYRTMWDTIQQTDAWQGIIWNRRKSGEEYQEWLSIRAVRSLRGLITHYIGISADMTRINHAETPQERHAHFDVLTGLPNRLLFQSRMEQALAEAQSAHVPFAVLFLDLDGFKEVNDRYGHSAGDQLLIAVADRLGKLIRQNDTLARFGGDEFVGLLTKTDPAKLKRICHRFIEACHQPFWLEHAGEIHIGLSIGWALYPQHGSDVSTLMHRADQALYQAKRNGKGRAVCYDCGVAEGAR